ncbi:MAG: carboxypeptidase regulatory-like domain-containing protein [Acidobacteriia bacterium]|nr:carboxypeptidase regulatory-like domain-containing protein [Terriglobia bacterium]
MAGSNRRAVLLLLGMAAVAAAQAPAREEAKPSRVEGVVMNALTGEPLPQAHVTFDVPGNRKAKVFGAITTAEGKFAIGPIDPGNYRAKANRQGYVASGAPVDVKVAPGDAVRDIELKLAPHAVIAGRVVDGNGDPVESVQVEAVRGGARSEHRTNARGEFRLGGLPAGQYLVRALPGNGGRDQELRTDGSQDENYGVTYYPGARSEQEGAVVEARAGAETGGIEIRLARAPVVRLSGKVTNAPEGARDYYMERTDVRFASTGQFNGPKFALWRLPSGRSALYVSCEDLNGREWESALMEFDMGDANIDNFDLPVMLPFDVSGRVDWDGQAPSSGDPLAAGLRLQAFTNWGHSAEGRMAENGTFRISKTSPGRYRVELAGAPADAYVKSVRQGAVEMANRTVDLRYGPGEPISVKVSTQGAQIAGVVRNEKGPVAGMSVGLVGDDPLEFDLFRSVETGADGGYSLRGLAPGKYRVFIFDTEDYDALRKNRTLPFYATPGEAIEVREAEKITRDLRLPR